MLLQRRFFSLTMGDNKMDNIDYQLRQKMQGEICRWAVVHEKHGFFHKDGAGFTGDGRYAMQYENKKDAQAFIDGNKKATFAMWTQRVV